MFCTNCGNQIAGNSAFCIHCGAKIGSAQGMRPVPSGNQFSMGGNQSYQNQQPQYGLPQGQPYQVKQSSWYIGPLQLTYDQVPVFRKRWFVILTWLIFPPVLIFIAFSGDIYALRSGVVYKEKYSKIWGILGLLGTIFMIFYFFG